MRHKLLVVDDDVAALEGLADLLETAGYDVHAAPTFEDGRRLLSEVGPDLLVVDVRLGAFNGLHLVFRGRFEQPALAAVVTTGFPDPVIEAETKRYDAAYLVKPVRPAALLSAVARQLERRNRPDARRWPRKSLAQKLVAEVGDLPATVVDASAGGLRVLVASGPAELPRTFNLYLPTIRLEFQVDTVWVREEAGALVCGGTFSESDEATVRKWRETVDALPDVPI